MEANGKELKELLFDLGPDLKDAINQIEIKASKHDNKVLLVIDFSKSEFLGEFLTAFKQYLSVYKQSNTLLKIESKTTYDYQNYKETSLLQLAKEHTQVNISF